MITGIPFGGENLNASEWRELSDNARFNFFDLKIEPVLNTITIKEGSRLRYGEFRLLFGSDEIITLPTSNIADTSVYLFITANQATNEFSSVQYSETLPSNSDQNGLFDIIIGQVRLYSGVSIITNSDITLNQAFYETTQQNGQAHDPIAISATRLPVGVHNADNLLDTFGTGIIQVSIKPDGKRYMVGIGDDGNVYISFSTDSPAVWNKQADPNDNIVNNGLALAVGDNHLITELDGNDPYDMGYRWLVFSNNASTISPIAIPIRKGVTHYTGVTNTIATTSAGTGTYNYSYVLTLEAGLLTVVDHMAQVMVNDEPIKPYLDQTIKYVELRKV